jgi:phosphotransferase family enzyme
MSRPITPCVLTEGLGEHEAFQAWRQVRPDDGAPGRIEVLQRNKKTSVYRLSGIGPDGAAVIAKRARDMTGRVERVVYEEVLPRIPLPSLHCYGYVGESTGEFSWLFVEDAKDEPYSRLNDSHRALAGRWLGELHLAADGVAGQELPDRGIGHYRQVLQDCRCGLELLAAAGLAAQDAVLISGVMSFCDQLAARWQQIEDTCGVLPHTLVHGDFATKNVRIRDRAAGQALLVFDWQFAGWGVPAADLAQCIDRVVSPDLGAYQSVIARKHPSLDMAAIRRIAACGNVLRVLDQVRWALSGLRVADPKWVTKACALMRAYQTTVVATMQRLATELDR